VEKGGKKNNKGKYGCIVVGVFLELHLQIDNTHTHSEKNNGRNLVDMIVCATHFPAYIIYTMLPPCRAMEQK
jgi:hypothetical protein